MGEGRDQPSRDRHLCGHVDDRRRHVVRGLPEVHVIVGVDRPPGPQRHPEQLVGPVRDHLVGVHVRGGAAAGLEDVDPEVVVEQPVGDLAGRRHDGLRERRVEQAEVGVGPGGGPLERPEDPEVPARQTEVADGERLDRALGLGPPQDVVGDVHRSAEVALLPVPRQRRRTRGGGVPDGGFGAHHVASTATYLTSRFSSMPRRPPSLPRPDCFIPPNGAAGFET